MSASALPALVAAIYKRGYNRAPRVDETTISSMHRVTAHSGDHKRQLLLCIAAVATTAHGLGPSSAPAGTLGPMVVSGNKMRWRGPLNRR